MIRIFRNKSIGGIIAVIFLCIIVHLHFFFTPVQINSVNNDGLLSVLLNNCVNSFSSTAVFLIYVIFILLQAILLNLVLSNLKMFKTKGYTIAMSYVLFLALIPQWHNLSPAFIANTFGIWLFYLLSKLYNNSSVKPLLFYTGLLIAVTCLFYFPFVSFFIFSFFALAILRPFNVKEWIILLLGYLTPFYLLFSYLFLTDKLNYNYIKDFIPPMENWAAYLPVADNITLIKLGFGVLIFLFGFFQLSTVRNQMLIQVRRYWSLMLIYLLLVTGMPFVFPNSGIEGFIICVIPLSSFIANFFALPQKKLWFVNFIFFIFIVLIMHTNWMLIKI